MKTYITTIIFLLASFIAQTEAATQEPTFVMVEAEIYDFETNKEIPPEDQILAGEITQKPRLITELGKDATIEIGKQDENGKFTDLFKLVTTFPKDKTNYLLELHLIKGEHEKVLSVEGTLEKTMLITTSVAGMGKGVRIKTKLLKELPKSQ